MEDPCVKLPAKEQKDVSGCDHSSKCSNKAVKRSKLDLAKCNFSASETTEHDLV